MRIVPILVALVLAAPFTTAGTGLTDAVQDDPGPGMDASDDPAAPTMLEKAGEAGWMSGTLVPVDDEMDAYGVVLQLDGTPKTPALTFVIDPPAPLDVAIQVFGPRGQMFFMDSHGAGGAEVVDLGQQAQPGLWTFAVVAQSKVGADGGVPHDGSAGSGAFALDYDMVVLCEPYC